jgi:hypothetical protein
MDRILRTDFILPLAIGLSLWSANMKEVTVSFWIIFLGANMIYLSNGEQVIVFVFIAIAYIACVGLIWISEDEQNNG